MNKVLNVKRKDGIVLEVYLKELDLSYINKIMELQNIVLQGLEDRQLYVPTNREEFISYLNSHGKILGCVTEEDELIAFGVYLKRGYDKSNYGYDVGIEGEELLKVGHIDTTIVKEEYRGNSLQKIICKVLEEIGKEQGTPIMCATASPYNKFSVNTFIKLGYEIKADKIKYGGLRRYVLIKNTK
ncbi:GNAT family N-acetyltransferase [Clostridium tarantellae]|uniref:GNAT family N-acetyltransferase n=1 Tax=Clostridium tarantellae TaxID=39493 RepID=A0A6I1MHQ5_9CLOT|nr:GNAT family N-acetyltransferase [Clostridium tarantellae]MPQ43066.1 GNAT family N-acetyltransferase [Clostridium tarantellae]